MILRLALVLFLSLLLVAVAVLFWLWPRYDYLPAEPLPFSAERVGREPIIHAGLSKRLTQLARKEGAININGPSLLRVPDWVDDPLGRYYVYFAHHKGDHIRMAYADIVIGPWTVYEPGTLTLADSGFSTVLDARDGSAEALRILWENYSVYIVRDMLLLSRRSTVTDPALRRERGIPAAANSRPHIASPEVVADHDRQRIVMYYHGLAGSVGQHTRVAVSADGLEFTTLPGVVHSNYLRMFRYRDQWYGLAMPGILYRTPDGVSDFQPRDRLLFEPDMRHAGLWVRGDTLYVFWSRVGDAPESILVSTVDLSSRDWDAWQATAPRVLLRPELPWEGSELKIESSLRGELGLAANELRDPYVFTDDDGESYLLYVGSGEQAIGLVRLVELP